MILKCPVQARVLGRGVRWEGGPRGRGHMCTCGWFTWIWQKAAQYCKAIILQLKINNFFKKWSCLSTTSYKCGNILGSYEVKVAQLCPTLCNPMDYTVHGILLSQNTGVGSLSLLQGIFPTQGSNPDLPHCRWFFTSWAIREAARQLWSRMKRWLIVHFYVIPN